MFSFRISFYTVDRFSSRRSAVPLLPDIFPVAAFKALIIACRPTSSNAEAAEVRGDDRLSSGLLFLKRSRYRANAQGLGSGLDRGCIRLSVESEHMKTLFVIAHDVESCSLQPRGAGQNVAQAGRTALTVDCAAIALATSSSARYLPLIAVGRSVFSPSMRIRLALPGLAFNAPRPLPKAPSKSTKFPAGEQDQ